MLIDPARFRRIVHQFRRRGMLFAGVAAVLLVVAGALIGPTRTLGAILLAIGTSVIASLIVAAAALERDEIAQSLMAQGIERVFDNRKTAFNDVDWPGLVRSARGHYRVLGTANHGYLYDEQARIDTAEAFKEALTKHKVTAEVLWLKPDSEIAGLRQKEEGRKTVEDTIESILFFWDLKDSLPAEAAQRLSLREYDTLPSCGITWADNQIIVTHYLAGRRNLGSPGLVLGAGLPRFDRWIQAVRAKQTAPPPISEVYARNYREVASDRHSQPIDAGRIQDLRELQETHPSPGVPSEREIRRTPGEEEESA